MSPLCLGGTERIYGCFPPLLSFGKHFGAAPLHLLVVSPTLQLVRADSFATVRWVQQSGAYALYWWSWFFQTYDRQWTMSLYLVTWLSRDRYLVDDPSWTWLSFRIDTSASPHHVSLRLKTIKIVDPTKKKPQPHINVIGCYHLNHDRSLRDTNLIGWKKSHHIDRWPMPAKSVLKTTSKLISSLSEQTEPYSTLRYIALFRSDVQTEKIATAKRSSLNNGW